MGEIKKTQENVSFVINETLKSQSFEFGKAGNRFKLYFSDSADLQKQVKNLIADGFIDPEDAPNVKKPAQG